MPIEKAQGLTALLESMFQRQANFLGENYNIKSKNVGWTRVKSMLRFLNNIEKIPV